jgi:hypothetical protein
MPAPVVPPRSPSRSAPSSKIVSHGNVAARKMATPVVPVAASSMTGKKGHASPNVYRNSINDGDNDEFGSMRLNMAALAAVSISPKTTLHSMATHSQLPTQSAPAPAAAPALTPTTARRSGAGAAGRVSFAHPLFSISERSENTQGTAVPTLARSPSAVPQPRRASSGTPADDTTVNKWPWGARRVTPVSADVAAARSRGSV